MMLIHTMEYFAAVKMNELHMHVTQEHTLNEKARHRRIDTV